MSFCETLPCVLFLVKFLGARRIPSLASLQKEGLVCSGMAHSCGILSCLALAYGVTCENSINGESYLNSSWDNERPGAVSDVPHTFPGISVLCFES